MAPVLVGDLRWRSPVSSMNMRCMLMSPCGAVQVKPPNRARDSKMSISGIGNFGRYFW